MNTSIGLVCSCFLLTLFACSVPSKKTEQPNVSASNEVQLSEEQFNAIQIRLGSADARNLSGTIKANGMLDVPPQNLVSISAPFGGFVKSTELLQGMRIKKGQVVVVLEHPDYIQLQQDYLESKTQLDFLEQEYNRQVNLSEENVNALKALQHSKSTYFSMKAKVDGLAAKLTMVNLDPISVASEGIKSSINIISPISGFVSEVNVNIGMHVNPTDVMFRIVDTEHVHAEAQVFEADIPKLKIGQRAHIFITNEFRERFAKVFLIGKVITLERTVRCHCHLEGEDADLIPGTYFSALIETGLSSVPSLPTEAIVNFEAKNFVFVERDSAAHRYELIEIKVGSSGGGYVEISSALPEFRNKIVIRGSFELLNVLKNVEK